MSYFYLNWSHLPTFTLCRDIKSFFLFPFLSYFNICKVQLFWDGHKNLTQLSSRFWRYLVMSKCQIILAFSEKLNFSLKNYKFGRLPLYVHSRSKCLVWFKKCCHIWLDQNFDPSLLTKKLWPFFMRMKQFFFFFFEKKNFKMADWKKAYFPKSPILKIFSQKFHGLVLGLVGLNDAKPIDMAQPI